MPRDLLADPPKRQPRDLLATYEAPAPDTSGIAPQALSGVNEGIANLLSLPNNLIGGAEMGLRSIGPGLVNLFGGDAAMPTEPLLKLPDAGQNYRNIANEIGAIKPETEEVSGQVARRVGEEVGASLLPWLKMPAKVAGAASTLGSGAGAALMEQLFPDNQFAELVGQMVFGGGTLAATNAAERKAAQVAAPIIDELKDQARKLYDDAGARGVRFSQAEMKQIVDDIAAKVMSEGLDPTLHPGATAAMKRLVDASATGMTVKDAQTLRRVISAAGKDVMNPDQGRIAGIMLDDFDTFVGRKAPELGQARKLYHQAKKAETLQELVKKAEDNAGANYNAAGFETALRQQFKSLLHNKRALRGFTAEEIAAIREIVRGGPIDNAMRWLGRFSMGSPFSAGVTALGPASLATLLTGNPVVGGAVGLGTMVAGQGARHAATKATTGRAQVLDAMVRRGGKANVPVVTPGTAQVAEALLMTQAANQNAPRDAVAEALIRANAR